MKRAKIGTHVSSSKTLDLVFDRGKMLKRRLYSFLSVLQGLGLGRKEQIERKKVFYKKRKISQFFLLLSMLLIFLI